MKLKNTLKGSLTVTAPSPAPAHPYATDALMFMALFIKLKSYYIMMILNPSNHENLFLVDRLLFAITLEKR